MRVGRPKKIGNEFCSSHKTLGFTYPVEPKPNHVYLRFRHNVRTIKDHYIDGPLRYATEYNRNNQVTLFSSKSYDSMKYYPPIRDYHNDAIPIVIYNIDMMKIPFELRDKIKEMAITEKEKNWILKSKIVKMQSQVKHFYNVILNSGVVTFGHHALKLGDRIIETETGFIGNGNLTNMTDKYGMLDKILKMRERNEKIRKILREELNEGAEVDLLT